VAHSPHKICPRCQRPADLHAPQCENCGRPYRTQFQGAPDQTVMGAPDPGYFPQRYPEQQPSQVYVQVNAQQVAPYQEMRMDTYALVSLGFSVLGILFFCLFGWVFAAIGLGMGVYSVTRINRHSHLDGMPIAISGIVLSAPTLFFALWMLGVWMQALSASATAPH